MNIKKGDNVKIIKGKDRGKTGKVECVLVEKNRLTISGINIYKKHLKPGRGGTRAGIIDINVPVNRANVILVCPRCEKTTRISYRINQKSKNRICQKCHEVVDNI